jgi:hypothetical protein
VTTQTTSQSVNIGADYKVRVRKNANGETTQIVASEGSSEFVTGQVSISSTATQIVAARSTRRTVTITAIGTTDCYLGSDAVTTATGHILVGIKGGTITLETTQPVYAVTSSGTQTVSYWEEYD